MTSLSCEARRRAICLLPFNRLIFHQHLNSHLLLTTARQPERTVSPSHPGQDRDGILSYPDIVK
ncbi:hypothetical protein PGT21_019124 [Puccinia graminis f. sp. tritici]|uniref:Uncharacterized protein n=1 Tax=Puccinia graminis f. sp. tritici TaxID=56615 RepID=A0A5B0LLW4_PUCGR|nr:hypothetical protein PGT21_019124 [Puccinia graminis f. sp. tritici]